MNLVTEVSNNRAELLAVFNKEVAVLKELEKAVTNRADKAKNGEKERITARLTAVTKALTEVVSVEAGKALLTEQKELKEELTLTERIEQNMKAGVIAELEALAIPFYQQSAKAREAFTELYVETYNTTTPVTVQEDCTAIRGLYTAMAGSVGTVFYTLSEQNVLAKSWNGTPMAKQVKAKDGSTVTLGRFHELRIDELERIRDVVRQDSSKLGGGR